MSDETKDLTPLQKAYLDGVVAEHGVYGDESEWKVKRHEVAEPTRNYWEERAALRYPRVGAVESPR